MNQTLVPVESVARVILVLRGQKVILDADLARLYGTSTMRLNQAVKRNLNRFPGDFVFQLTPDEKQEVITKCDIPGLKFSRVLPYAFTEHGAVMAATILKTERAAMVSVYVVRAFVQLRELLATHAELAEKLAELDVRLTSRLDEHDEQIGLLMEAIRQLMVPPDTPRRRIGFRPGEEHCGPD